MSYTIELTEQEVLDLITACESDGYIEATSWQLNDVEADRKIAEEHARIKDIKSKLKGLLNEKVQQR